MLRTASSLVNSEIIDISGQKIGRVLDFVIDYESNKVLAIVVSKRAFSGFKIVSVLDILDVKDDFFIVESINNIVDSSEIVRVEESVNKKIRIIGSKAVTESGEVLGKAFDFVIDLSSFYIQRVYIKKGSFLNERAIPADRIIKITSKKIIFSDDLFEKNLEVLEPA